MDRPRLERPHTTSGAHRRLVAATAMLLWVALTAAAYAQSPRTLYLVRHGEYDHQDPRPPEEGKGLVSIGVAQARLLGARLRAHGLQFDAFDASPLTRARQTAELIAEDLPGTPLRIVADLAECTPPTRRLEVISGETEADLEACRVQLDRLFAERFVPASDRARNELLVAHGNVIRYLVTRALGVDTHAWLEMSIHNASLTVIRVEADGRFKVIALGDSGHLPTALTTGATGDPDRDLAPPD